MKAEELRIKNKVNLSGEIVTVKSIEFNNINQEYFIKIFEDFRLPKVSFLNPISLTEEILLKCGFEKTKEIDSWELKGFGFVDISTPQCKYLHQLQNLYFALTGEELTINL